MDITLILSIGVLLGCFLAISWFAGSEAPYVPTKKDIIRDVLKKAGVKKGVKFYELGSGDGRVVLEAAKLKSAATGIEQSILRVWYSQFKSYRQNLKLAKFIHGSIFSRDYKDADVVYMYLLNKGVWRLEDKLKRELKKGAIVITQTYHFRNWRPFLKITPQSNDHSQLANIIGAGNFWIYRR